jgi:hypothetical protein
VDPVRWLVRRQRGIKTTIWAGALVWLFGGSGFPVYLFILLSGGGIPLFLRSFNSISMAIMLLQGCLFGWAASRFFVEARRNGELELLQTSPVGAKTIVSCQWKELKRLFVWPVAVMVAFDLLGAVIFIIQQHSTSGLRAWLIGTHALNCCDIIFGAGALIWAGLWFGLRARSQASAIVLTVLVARGVPYVLTSVGRLLLTLLESTGMFRSSGVNFNGYSTWQSDLALFLNWLPSLAILFYYLWLIRWARRRLAGDLRDVPQEELTLGLFISGARARLDAIVRKARSWPSLPEG